MPRFAPVARSWFVVALVATLGFAVMSPEGHAEDRCAGLEGKEYKQCIKGPKTVTQVQPAATSVSIPMFLWTSIYAATSSGPVDVDPGDETVRDR